MRGITFIGKIILPLANCGWRASVGQCSNEGECLMRSICRFSVTIVLAACLSTAVRASVDWSSVPFVENATLQAVNSAGRTTYGGTFPIQIEGIVLNNPTGELNATAAATADEEPYNLGGQFQFFIQPVYVSGVTDPIYATDHNGTEIYMAQNYGNLPPVWGDPAYNISNANWNAEVARVTGNGTLHAGDLVMIEAQGGLEYQGMFNINDEHEAVPTYDSATSQYVNGDASPDPDFQFNVVVLQAGFGLPTATPIHLSDVITAPTSSYPQGEDTFDATGAAGGEHYQGTLVKLESVSIVSGTWAPYQTIEVADASGRQFPIILGSDVTGTAPTGLVDITGVFAQESTDFSNTPSYVDGYEMFVDSSSGIVAAVPEPASLGVLSLAAMGLVKRWRR